MNNNQDQIDDFMYRTFGYRPLRKAPTESGLPPEQHDALMRRFFPNEAPASAPAPSALSEEEHAALMRRFPASTPAPAPATHEPETPETAEDWAETHSALLPSDQPGTPSPRFSRDDSMYSRRGTAYRAARPRQSRTGLRPHGADEEGTPMRTMRVNGQPAITYRRASDNVPLPRGALRDNEEAKEANQRIAAVHAKQGTLTDGTEFLNLGALSKHQADLIAKEYAKWRESGGGPLPDLSKYENLVARRKDGTPWDYRESLARMGRLHAHAARFDPYHKHHEPAMNFSSNGNLLALDPQDIWNHALDPQYIWNHIDVVDYDDRDETRRPMFGAASAIFLDQLKRTGLRPHQYPSQTRSLVNLGLHHQRLSRLHAEGTKDE